MQFLRQALITGGIVLACAGGVRADGEWQNVAVQGFRLDIPASVGDTYKSPPGSAGEGAELLMSFGDDAGNASMTCVLMRLHYSKDISHEFLVKAVGNGETFCRKSQDTVSDWESGDTEPMTADGQPAAMCNAAYNDSSEKRPGQVDAIMTVAGNANIYQLECDIGDADKAKAVSAYVTYWKDDISHVWNSLRLPASEK